MRLLKRYFIHSLNYSFVLLTIISCRSNYYIPQLPAPVELKVTDSLCLVDLSVADILVKDSLIIITNSLKTNEETVLSRSAFHFFDSQDLSKIAEVGELGDDPGMLRMPVITNLGEEERIAIVKDRSDSSFYSLDYRNLLSDKRASISLTPGLFQKLQIPDLDKYPGITKVSDDNYILYGIGDEPITIFQKSSGGKRELPFIEYFTNLDYINNIMLNRSFITADKTNELFFVALDILDRVVLFNSSGYVIRQNIFSDIPTPASDGKFIHHYGDIYSTGKYCYLNRFEDINNLQNSRLLLFDWGGRLIKVYKSPAGFGQIAVSDDGTIYTTVLSEKGYTLYELKE
ncbi:MAG: hypothetical protein PHP30_04940 [Bacteroidales bacterium]|nr:hypothetical protein [Bacteroidales bacterium]MDD2425571.1 hypothetical protein [Bacteroidales bacterium]MDD3989427.1 hypothetical protein [Bacteroidales bacterium]MDD4638257.1 hypothetical protein [Bacteroidales bacterium]